MTLPVQLGVRLGSKRVTRELRRLRFRSTVPGGFAWAQFALDRPISRPARDARHFVPVVIDDARNALTAWEGRLEDLGRTVSDDGQVWDLTAVGTSAHALDKTVPRIWCDRVADQSRWRRGYGSNAPYGRVDYTDADADPEIPAIIMLWTEGSTTTSIGSPSRVDIGYRAIYDCGQELGRVRVSWDDGATTANRENQLVTRSTPGDTSGITVDSDTWSTTPGSLVGSRGGGTAITAGETVAIIRIEVVGGGSVVVGSTAWAEFSEFLVRSLLKDINGSDITSGYTNDYVLSGEIIKDMIGRGDLFKIDPARSVIETGLAHIDNFAYPLGIAPGDGMDELMELETNPMFWAIWESGPTGLYRMEWTTWSGGAWRYTLDATDGIDAPSTGGEIRNEALVAYTDWAGRDRTVLATNPVAVLTDAGLTRTLPLDITGQKNSAANATGAGDRALDEHDVAPNAGTLTVAGRVWDAVARRWIMPWEMRPGHLVRVKGVVPSADQVNGAFPASQDGTTVFKLIAVEFDSETAAATLELDTFPVSVARALADLKVNRRKRKRAA